MAKKNFKKTSDTPRKQKGVGSTLPDPSFSLGNKERELLRYLFLNQNKRFNVKDYARNIAKIPRTSVYDYLNKLQELGFVSRDLADNRISQKGIILVESQEAGGVGRGVGASRGGCREINKLSTHYHKFKAVITEKKNLSMANLRRLNPREIKENKLANLHQIFVYFDDATILINPKQVIISIYDVETNNVEESDMKCLSRAVDYSIKLMKAGVETEGIFVEEGHWARINSALGDFLHDKIDGKYFLDLGDGKKFWIDHSPDKFGNPKREDETNDKVVRERVDNFLTQISKDEYDLQDINKVKESLGFITKLESARLMDQIEETKLKRLQLEQNNLSLQTKSDFIPGYLG